MINSRTILSVVMVSLLMLSFLSVVMPNTLRVKSVGSKDYHEHLFVESVSYTFHVPIEINDDDDFDTQGWPGSGTQGEPYMISSLNITADDVCISIQDTTVYFEITACYISSPTEIESLDDGISISNALHGKITDCIIENHCNGVVINDCQDITITGTVVSDCASSGFSVQYSDDTILVDNVADTNEKGFELFHSSDCNLTNNLALDNIMNGFDLFQSVRSTLLGNTASNNSVGMYLSGSALSVMIGNTIASTENDYDYNHGFHLRVSDACTIQDNTISGSYYGIHLYYSDDCIIEDNNISHNNFGIFLESSEFTTIHHNTISENNSDGLFLQASFNSTVTNNVIILNSGYGILLDMESESNIFYLNWLGNNSLSDALDNGPINFWDDSVSKGNYWFSYNGTGTYPIDGDAGSVDNYPRTWNYIPTTSTTDITNTGTETEGFVLDPLTGVIMVLGVGIIIILIVVVYIKKK